MNSICVATSRHAAKILAMVLVVVTLLVVHSAVGSTYAFEGEAVDTGPGIVSPPQETASEDGDPEANLPYLFAVFIITWGAFFGYVFVMSRRQREMQREIEALRLAIEARERESREDAVAPGLSGTKET